jgi:cobalt-zinc-cadmium resistance protein CzcA
MFERILKISIYQRGLVLLAVLAMAAFGMYNYLKLPIDAVPDITNVQVQINTTAPGYSPLEAEQRITFPIEMAMAGLPGLEYTRSLSRYGLSQVTVIFKDGTDIYLVRQLVSQRIQEVRSRLPVAIVPTIGPISTGLGKFSCGLSMPIPRRANRMARHIRRWICANCKTGSSNPACAW